MGGAHVNGRARQISLPIRSYVGIPLLLVAGVADVRNSQPFVVTNIRQQSLRGWAWRLLWQPQSPTYLQVRELLLYLWPFLSILLNLFLELFLSPLFPSVIHSSVDGLVDIVSFSVIGVVRARGKQTSSIS